MQCTKCKYLYTRVVRRLHDDKHDHIKRRRECLKCGMRFNTMEEVSPDKRLNDEKFYQETK